MAYEVDGKTIEADADGYLVDTSTWSEAVAAAIAVADEVEMTDKHWDVVNYLRDQHINNAGAEPNERTIAKDIGKIWGKKPSRSSNFAARTNVASMIFASITENAAPMQIRGPAPNGMY